MELEDISSISWRENKLENNGKYNIVNKIKLDDFIIFEADGKFFEVNKNETNELYGGFVTGLDSNILKFSTSPSTNKYRGYSSRHLFQGKKNSSETPMEIKYIKRYSILLRD